MTYSIIFKQSVLKDLRKIPEQFRRNIWSTIDDLKNNPTPDGCIQIQGYEDFYRIRIGKYRIIYEVAKKVCIITVIKVGHRKDVYKHF